MSQSSKSTALSLSKRELLLGALATAVTLATPQSRLLAASHTGPVKLALSDGKTLEVHKERVFLLAGARRRRVHKGVFSLASGGRVELHDGRIVAATMGPGDPFVKATWIEIHSPGGGNSQPQPGAADWLKSNAGRRLNQ